MLLQLLEVTRTKHLPGIYFVNFCAKNSISTFDIIIFKDNEYKKAASVVLSPNGVVVTRTTLYMEPQLIDFNTENVADNYHYILNTMLEAAGIECNTNELTFRAGKLTYSENADVFNIL